MEKPRPAWIVTGLCSLTIGLASCQSLQIPYWPQTFFWEQAQPPALPVAEINNKNTNNALKLNVLETDNARREKELADAMKESARLEKELADAMKENARLKKELADAKDDNSLLKDLAEKKER